MARTNRESILPQMGRHSKWVHGRRAHNSPFLGHADQHEGKAGRVIGLPFVIQLMLKELWALVIQIVTR